LVQDAKAAELGRHEVTIQVLDVAGLPLTETSAGASTTVRVAAFPAPAGGGFYAELQIRHLESGVLVFRGQSLATGIRPLTLAAGRGMEIVWSFNANLARGHYAISCVILNEHHRWVAVSAPSLLTVNERQSEQALAFIDLACTVREIEHGREPGRSPNRNNAGDSRCG